MYHIFLFMSAFYVGLNSMPTLPDEGYSYVPSKPYKMPEPCEQETFCFEKGADYPEDKIQAVVKEMKPKEKPIDTGDRDGGADNSNDDLECPSNKTRMYDPIYYILDKNSYKIRVVVQLPEKFEQIYTVKWCENPGPITKDTSHFLEYLSQIYNIKCINATMELDFHVLSDDGKRIEIATADIPVYCKCHYSKK